MPETGAQLALPLLAMDGGCTVLGTLGLCSEDAGSIALCPSLAFLRLFVSAQGPLTCLPISDVVYVLAGLQTAIHENAHGLARYAQVGALQFTQFTIARLAPNHIYKPPGNLGTISKSAGQGFAGFLRDKAVIG